MARNLVVAIIVVISGSLGLSAEDFDMKQTRDDFERLAAELPYLSLTSVLFDRPDDRFEAADSKKTEKHSQVLGKVTDGTHTKGPLVRLLTHNDAKVRTLAAVALFDSEDPTVLPALVELAKDNSATYDGHPELSEGWLMSSGIGPPVKEQTVGEIATKMVSFYMERSGFHYGISHKTQPGFAEYWGTRSNRSHCASWFAVQLDRASQGTSPTRIDCKDRVRLVRKRIDKLPPDERTWIFLWLNGESGSDALTTEEELIEECHSVGADKLLLMLQKQIPSDDPDLKPRSSNNWPYRRMQHFVLRHAHQLLRRSDSKTLLSCERWERDYQKHGISDPTITAWWAVAAARLEPTNASPILHAAIERFQGEFDSDEQATLHIALWQLCGKPELKFVKDWFFEAPTERGSFPNSRGQFIEAMRKEPNGKEIVAEIIRDKRLDDLDWQSLRRLITAVNSWTAAPILAEDELNKVWHPLGEGHYHWGKDEAMKNYPKETKELEAHLSDWRTRLRECATELSN